MILNGLTWKERLWKAVQILRSPKGIAGTITAVAGSIIGAIIGSLL